MFFAPVFIILALPYWRDYVKVAGMERTKQVPGYEISGTGIWGPVKRSPYVRMKAIRRGDSHLGVKSNLPIRVRQKAVEKELIQRAMGNASVDINMFNQKSAPVAPQAHPKEQTTNKTGIQNVTITSAPAPEILIPVTSTRMSPTTDSSIPNTPTRAAFIF
ncbi:unnamed protein product, partial [Allacma fusca]